MKVSDYIEGTPLFKFNKLKCLRNDYFHNNCSFCMDICPESAFELYRGKLRLLTNKCTNCSACIGSCPAEAVNLESFDENNFALNNKDALLSCQKNIPCLAIFDEHHLIYMALNSNELNCDLSKCEGCEVNRDKKVENQIKNSIEISNKFLKAIEIDKKIEIKKDIEINKRRYLLSKIIEKAKLKSEEKEIIELDNLKRIPLKKELFNKAIDKVIEELKITKVENFDFLQSKEISDSCINCTDCVEFCPTDALFKNSEETTILFQVSKCINCDICNDICKYDSVKSIKEVDLIDFVLGRAKPIIVHNMKTCKECKMPFSYKGGELICSRCIEFKHDFTDIFKLASELD